MDLSMKWLNDYVKADMPIKEFCDGMTMSGSKVETWTKQGADITNVVVGKCVAMEKHPDADTLGLPDRRRKGSAGADCYFCAERVRWCVCSGCAQ